MTDARPTPPPLAPCCPLPPPWPLPPTPPPDLPHLVPSGPPPICPGLSVDTLGGKDSVVQTHFLTISMEGPACSHSTGAATRVARVASSKRHDAGLRGEAGWGWIWMDSEPRLGRANTSFLHNGHNKPQYTKLAGLCGSSGTLGRELGALDLGPRVAAGGHTTPHESASRSRSRSQNERKDVLTQSGCSCT